MSGEFRSVIGRGFGHTSAEKKKNSKRMKNSSLKFTMFSFLNIYIYIFMSKLYTNISLFHIFYYTTTVK